MNKILNFKMVSPMFKMAKDGTLPFTTRQVDHHDPRFRALAQWRPGCDWGIRITNPKTGHRFIRKLVAVDFVHYLDKGIAGPLWERLQRFENWKILVLGELVEEG